MSLNFSDFLLMFNKKRQYVKAYVLSMHRNLVINFTMRTKYIVRKSIYLCSHFYLKKNYDLFYNPIRQNINNYIN